MKRRTFLKTALGAGAAAAVPRAWAQERHAAWEKTWYAALETLAGNVRRIPNIDHPVLIEGSVYSGTWQECGPHESLAYAQLSQFVQSVGDTAAPIEVAKNTHRAFFTLQREDGQLPASVKLSGISWGQIQMVVPIAATAWEISQTAQDESFLSEAYNACSRWDAWLRHYRDTRGTGLVEAFCTYDTGQDNSPRWAGVSNECPEHDAKRFAPGQSMPRLCPDLSATVFGGRVALSAMATALGKEAEAHKWMDDAERIRSLILEKLWCDEDASFYDVDPEGRFVRIRSVANCRVLGEHILRLGVPRERAMFDALWERQLHNPQAYWAKYPLPSIALDDPKFVRPIPRNSWGGASQALTALRTLRWMEHYGKARELRVLMQAWCDAIVRAGAFCQQMDPGTGVFTQPDPGGYSPSALVFLHFALRLGRGASWRASAGR
jgi:Bacterial alpha-L-rhamnosidase 6 hairpin glycosidase domain/TAT (twin-arginine translocation) pathway signal sequence